METITPRTLLHRVGMMLSLAVCGGLAELQLERLGRR